MKVRHTPIRKVSPKRQAQLSEYYALIEKLRTLCGNRSELSGIWGVEPHHIRGRWGKRLLDPFNIIFLTHEEHMVEQGQWPGKPYGKEYLLKLVKEIRGRQGFGSGIQGNQKGD